MSFSHPYQQWKVWEFTETTTPIFHWWVIGLPNPPDSPGFRLSVSPWARCHPCDRQTPSILKVESLKKNTQQKLSLKKKLHGDSAKDSMKGGKTYVTSTLQVGNFIFCIKDILKHNIPPLILQRKYETCFFGDGIRHVEDVVTELSTKVGYICKVAQLPPVENHQLPTPNSE